MIQAIWNEHNYLVRDNGNIGEKQNYVDNFQFIFHAVNSLNITNINDRRRLLAE